MKHSLSLRESTEGMKYQQEINLKRNNNQSSDLFSLDARV
jgi:hypothetical protein